MKTGVFFLKAEIYLKCLLQKYSTVVPLEKYVCSTHLMHSSKS